MSGSTQLLNLGRAISFGGHQKNSSIFTENAWVMDRIDPRRMIMKRKNKSCLLSAHTPGFMLRFTAPLVVQPQYVTGSWLSISDLLLKKSFQKYSNCQQNKSKSKVSCFAKMSKKETTTPGNVTKTTAARVDIISNYKHLASLHSLK